jgi:hypothetical protein
MPKKPPQKKPPLKNPPLRASTETTVAPTVTSTGGATHKEHRDRTMQLPRK